jgi:hypothetical protein
LHLSVLAMNILESRIGGFDLSIIDEEIETGMPDYRGPINLILPNIDFNFTFELSRCQFSPAIYEQIFYTGCARDRDLYKLVSCGKFVNEILFCIIYKTLYLTLGHHALGGILCSCLNLFEL